MYDRIMALTSSCVLVRSLPWIALVARVRRLSALAWRVHKSVNVEVCCCPAGARPLVGSAAALPASAYDLAVLATEETKKFSHSSRLSPRDVARRQSLRASGQGTGTSTSVQPGQPLCSPSLVGRMLNAVHCGFSVKLAQLSGCPGSLQSQKASATARSEIRGQQHPLSPIYLGSFRFTFGVLWGVLIGSGWGLERVVSQPLLALPPLLSHRSLREACTEDINCDQLDELLCHRHRPVAYQQAFARTPDAPWAVLSRSARCMLRLQGLPANKSRTSDEWWTGAYRAIFVISFALEPWSHGVGLLARDSVSNEVPSPKTPMTLKAVISPPGVCMPPHWPLSPTYPGATRRLP